MKYINIKNIGLAMIAIPMLILLVAVTVEIWKKNPILVCSFAYWLTATSLVAYGISKGQ